LSKTKKRKKREANRKDTKMTKEQVKRIERGWPSLFVNGDICRFNRNTLLERGDTRYIISTVGAYYPEKEGGCIKISDNGYYETAIFEAKEESGYWDIDIDKELAIPDGCDWAITDITLESDMLANEMHEKIVSAVQSVLENGKYLEKFNFEEQ